MNVRTFFVGALLVAGVMPLAAQFALLPASGRFPRSATVSLDAPSNVEWPTHFRDQPLTRMPLSELEQRFTRGFPGAVARFTDGERMLIARHVERPTRQLHPAADCFRAIGYTVERSRPVIDGLGEHWNCFAVARDGRRLRVCERISDQEGREWTDTSAWFWAAQYGGGPWRALTVVQQETGSP
jgi:hypothetical protein